MMLLANALIFFHMVRVRSLELNTGTAALVTVALITLGVIVQVSTTIMYGKRVARALPGLPKSEQHLEQQIERGILVFCAMLGLVMAFIGYVMLRGSLASLASFLDGQKNGAEGNCSSSMAVGGDLGKSPVAGLLLPAARS